LGRLFQDLSYKSPTYICIISVSIYKN